MNLISKSTRILTPSFPIERVFHERQLRQSIADKAARLDLMRAQLAATQKKVAIEHCMVGDEEMLLVSCGDGDGVAVAMDDLRSGAMRLQDAVDAVVA